MSHVLMITSSPRGANSLSTRDATEIADGVKARLGGTLTLRELAADPAPHITAAYIQGSVTPSETRTPEQVEAVRHARTLVDELQGADAAITKAETTVQSLLAAAA